MAVDPGYKILEKFAGGIGCYTMESKHFVSSISFSIKIENNDLVLFNGQSIIIELSIKEV